MSFRIKNKRTGGVAKYNALTKKECEDFILFVLEERPTEIKTFLWEDFKLADVEIFEEEVEETETEEIEEVEEESCHCCHCGCCHKGDDDNE